MDLRPVGDLGVETAQPQQHIGLRRALGLSADEPLEIEGVAEAPVAPPIAIPPAAPAVDEALTKRLAALEGQFATQGETLAAQTGIITSLTAQLAEAQKTTAEKERDAKLASAKARIVALKRAFKITPANEKTLIEQAEKDPDSVEFSLSVFEKNPAIASVNGIPGYTEDSPGEGIEEFADMSPVELAARVQKLADEKLKSNDKLKKHEALMAVLDENPQLAAAYASVRQVPAGGGAN